MKNSDNTTSSGGFAFLFRFGVAAALFGMTLLFVDVAFAFYKNLFHIFPSAMIFKAIALLAVVSGVSGFLLGLSLGGVLIMFLAFFKKEPILRLAHLALVLSIPAFCVSLTALIFVFVTAPSGLERQLPAATSQAAQHSQQPNVLLVVVDSLRQDVMERMMGEGLTPELQRFVGESTMYSDCLAPSSWTAPSMAGMITGQYPALLGSHTTLSVPEKSETLAEILKGANYQTMAVIDNYLIRPSRGFGQGYEHYWVKNNCIALADMFLFRRILSPDAFQWFRWHFHLVYTGAPSVNEAAQNLLEGRDPNKPYYLRLHYMDTHYPFYVYKDIPDNRSNLSTPKTFLTFHDVKKKFLADRPRPPFADVTMDPAQVKDFKDRYDGSIQYLDNVFGEFLRFAHEQADWDNTLVIFTADHGEEFLEHKFFLHGGNLYDETANVPLIVKWPVAMDMPVAASQTPVSSLQVMPTILHTAGIDLQGRGLQESLQAVDDQNPPHTVFAEMDHRGVEIYCARSGSYKRFFSRNDKGQELHELYNLDTDPGEQRNVFGMVEDDPELEEAFAAFLREVAPEEEVIKPSEISEDELIRLRSLGYMQ